MSHFSRLVVDSSATYSDLCILGAANGTDKSPYSFAPTGHHRHAYTAVYDLLFASKRFEPIVLGELGILDNKSMRMWREYFPVASLYGFEAFEERIISARADNLYNTKYLQADIKSTQSLFEALNGVGSMFDILIDDSTHLFDDQVRFVKTATQFLKAGGILIIEDIFRGWDEQKYVLQLSELSAYYSALNFVLTNHQQAFTDGTVEPYFNNDKLLILVRNNRPWPLQLEKIPENLKAIDSLIRDSQLQFK